MPVTDQTPIIAHTANGVSTAFAFPFLLDQASDLIVMVGDALKTLATDYTVSGTGNPAGGTVTFTSAPANGLRVVFTRRTALQRLTDYQTGGANRANVLDADLDRLWLALQDGWLGVQKAVRYQNGDSGPTRMPVLADGQVLGQLGGALVGRDLASADSMNFLQSGTGAVLRSMQDKAREIVSVKDFGAKGDGVTDDTIAIQSALNTGKPVYLPSGSYVVTNSLTIVAGGGIVGEGEKSKIIRKFTGGRLIGFPGGTAYGDPIILRDFYVTTDASVTVASGDTGIDIGYQIAWVGRGDISNIVITKQWVGLQWKGGSMNPISNVQCIHNFSHGFNSINGRGELYGCLAQYNWGNGYNYYMQTQAETGIQLTRCGTYANKGWGYAFDSAAGVIGANIYMMGVSSSTDGSGGIGFFKEYRQIWMDQILIESAGDAYIPYNANEKLPGEVAWTAITTAVGLYMVNNCRVTNIVDLLIQTCQGNGAVFDGADGLSICSATINENGRGQAGASAQNGVYFNANNSTVSLVGVRFTSSGGNTYQLADINSAQASNKISFSNCFFSTYVSAGGGLNIRHDNSVTSASNSVASASVLTLHEYTDFINVTGTTNIDAISAAYSGRRVTLKFNGALAVADGNNIKLASQFNSTADDTLTLVCDGVNWFEVCRSIN